VCPSPGSKEATTRRTVVDGSARLAELPAAALDAGVLR
jgi:hypothetical protein